MEDRRRVKEEKAKAVYSITTPSVRSIEEMAKLGMPFSILARNQKTWLLRGGLEYFKNEKPYLYPLIEKLVKNKDPAFPVSLSYIGDRVAERIGERDRIGVRSVVERIIRWKIEPFYIRSEKIRKIAKVLKEVVEEGYREDLEGYKYLRKSVNEWIKWNKKMMRMEGYEP